MDDQVSLHEVLVKTSYLTQITEPDNKYLDNPVGFGSGFIVQYDSDKFFVTADHTIHIDDYNGEIEERTWKDYVVSIFNNYTDPNNFLSTLITPLGGFYYMEQFHLDKPDNLPRPVDVSVCKMKAIHFQYPFLTDQVTFTNCTIFMKEASWIELSSFDSLYLTNTKIIGCSGWLGIRVLGGGLPRPGSNCGYLNMTASSIENAHIAVSAEAGGEVNTVGSRFLNNGMHIAYDSYSYPNNTIHINNSFGRLKTISCGGCTHPLTLPLKETNPMVYFEGVKDVSFVISKFEGLNTYNISNLSNIEAQSVDNVEIQNISFHNEADYGIYTKSNINSMISGNEFNDQNKYQPIIHQGAGSVKTGLYAETCQSLTIGPNNAFWCCKTGMEWYATSLNLQSNLFENIFKGCNNGLMFAQQVNPRDNTNLSLNVDTTNTRKLLIECNLFERDSLGIVGSGKLMDHGSGVAGVRNKFVDNINWDIATQNHFNYTYYGTTAYIPNAASGLLKNFVNLNTIPNIDFLSNSGGSVTCANGLFVLNDETKDKKVNINLPFGVTLFPNPVDEGILTIRFTDIPEETIKLQLHNSIGQKLRSEMLTDKEYTMNMQHLPPGVYHINMVSNIFRGTYKLIIK